MLDFVSCEDKRVLRLSVCSCMDWGIGTKDGTVSQAERKGSSIKSRQAQPPGWNLGFEGWVRWGGSWGSLAAPAAVAHLGNVLLGVLCYLCQALQLLLVPQNSRDASLALPWHQPGSQQHWEAKTRVVQVAVQEDAAFLVQGMYDLRRK